jgi:hypothetical protein
MLKMVSLALQVHIPQGHGKAGIISEIQLLKNCCKIDLNDRIQTLMSVLLASVFWHYSHNLVVLCIILNTASISVTNTPKDNPSWSCSNRSKL